MLRLFKHIVVTFTLFCSTTVFATEHFSTQQKAMLAQPRAQLELLNQIPPAQRSAEQWLLLGIGYDSLNNKEQALLAVEQALAAQLPPVLHVIALEQQAMIYGRLYRNANQALQILQQAEQAAQALRPNDPDAAIARLSSIYESFAQGYNQQGNLTQAEHYVTLAIELALQNQLTAAELPARVIAGRLSLQQNNYLKARQHFSRALELSQQLNRPDTRGSIHLRLGMAYQKIGDQQLAITHLQQAEQLNQQEQRLPNLLLTHITLSNSYLDTGAILQAQQQISAAERLLDKVRDPLLAAQLKQVSAQLTAAQQDYAGADQLFAQAHQLFQQLGNEQFVVETALQRADNAKHLRKDASVYLAAISAPEQLPLYLQLQYWQTLARVMAAEQNWSQAYQAQQQLSAIQQEVHSTQQRQQADLLHEQFTQAQLQQSASASYQHQLWLIAGSATLSVLLLQLTTYWWYRRRQTQGNTKLSPTGVKSWQSFVRQLKRQQSSTPGLSVLAIQLVGSSEYKLQLGEQLLRQQLRALLNELEGPGLLDYTVHTDVIWLAVDPQLFSQQRLWQTLYKHCAALPGQPSIRAWIGCLTELLGQRWNADAMQGLRELVWLSWQQASQLSHVMVQAHALAGNHCEWSHALIRQDLINAIALGQIRLIMQPQLMKAAEFSR